MVAPQGFRAHWVGIVGSIAGTGWLHFAGLFWPELPVWIDGGLVKSPHCSHQQYIKRCVGSGVLPHRPCCIYWLPSYGLLQVMLRHADCTQAGLNVLRSWLLQAGHSERWLGSTVAKGLHTQLLCRLFLQALPCYHDHWAEVRSMSCGGYVRSWPKAFNYAFGELQAANTEWASRASWCCGCTLFLEEWLALFGWPQKF